MGISLWANSVSNTIEIGYQHDFDPSEDATPVDLSIKVYHDYESSNFDNQSILLKTIIIPAAYVKVRRFVDGSVEHTITSAVINLRYAAGLFIQSSEIRESIPVFSERVPVLVASDLDDPAPTPSNPIKDHAFSENVPAIQVEAPNDNISVMKDVVAPVVEEGFVAENPQTKILPGSDGFTDQFNDGFVEDPVINYAPNPSFGTTQRMGMIFVPQGYGVSAPGFIIDSTIQPGDITDTFIWRISASNPNTFNAFNSLDVSFGSAAVPTGSDVWTWSVYARYKSDALVFPFSLFSLTWQFFNDAALVGSVAKTVDVSGLDEWQLLHSTLTGSEIPPSANTVKVSMTSGPVESTDNFVVLLYFPQLETLNEPSSRTLVSRPVADVYTTPSSFDINLPFYIALETHHKNANSIRGILDTTTALKNGIQFYASADTLFLKQLSSTGSVIFSKMSASFSLDDEEKVIYGVFADGNNIKFYINNALISSHPQVVVINQTVADPILGSLSMANTSLNTPIVRFGVFRVPPV